ncbi:phosphoribosylglycinamide formyltransferase [Nemorincola caseinilytica]|uniref:Phosphoribosylglycinamide formyltransferase n=1 Tax=Nemorincola caseinilytica TaxID=2054315 RepID=A0ABP8NAX2_9BACT
MNLIIFASGTGTNAAAIIEWFKANGKARVSLIVCNKPGAGVLNIAEREGIPVMMIDRHTFDDDATVAALRAHAPALIILAGYLWKIPPALTQAFPDRIINIHPALLPSYGGKGMYGGNVHTAVIAAGETHSGITIHYVNEEYDKGNVILQAHCNVLPGDTPGALAKRIHKLEHYYFPRTIEFLLDNMEA